MKPVWTATILVTVLNLGGCAASLIYDRDRPANDCRDKSQRCLQSGLPADWRDDRVRFPSGRALF